MPKLVIQITRTTYFETTLEHDGDVTGLVQAAKSEADVHSDVTHEEITVMPEAEYQRRVDRLWSEVIAEETEIAETLERYESSLYEGR